MTVTKFNDLRDEYISRVVAGKTFVDVGGLWGTVNEKVSVAHKHGAFSVTMLDVTVKDGDLWKTFRARMNELEIANYRCVSTDVCDPHITELVQPFDVVHCSGVLYHHPNPMLMLAILRNLAREHLVLTSCITPEIIENERGRYVIPPSGVLFVPALNDAAREILKCYWEQVGVVAGGLTEKVSYRLNDFGPWWWLPTASALVAMCEAAGFTVLDRGPIWGDNALVLLLRV
jgi:hypothetical protein